MNRHEAREMHRKRMVTGWKPFRKAMELLKTKGEFTVADLIILCDTFDMPVKTTMMVLSDKQLIKPLPTTMEYVYEEMTTGGNTLKKERLKQGFIDRHQYVTQILSPEVK